jgi:hypothetical protein
MKQTPEMDRIQHRMRPGATTQGGLLGADERPLVDILVADEAEVARLGLTHRRIAARMSELLQAGAPGLGAAVRFGERLEVTVESARGGLPCPFGDPGLQAKTVVTVRNLSTGGEMSYTDLNIHMIARHGFYEGRGARYRIEPARAAEILDLRAEDRQPDE